MHKQFTARRLPSDCGESGWLAIDQTTVTQQRLEWQQQVDYAIVGAGFAGLSAAWRLSQLQPEARIAIVEAGDIAQGPAGRNSGFMLDLPHELNSETYAGAMEQDIAQIGLNRYAVDFAEQLAQQLQLPSQVFDRCGKYTGAATANGAQHIDSYIQHLEALKEPFKLLDGQQMAELTGTEAYIAGLYTDKAAMIQPASYIRALAAGLPKNVQLFSQSPVLSIETGPLKTLKTAKGSISAEKVILAVNGHLESFGLFRGKLMHVMLYASMTNPLSKQQLASLGGVDDWGIVPADPMGSTVRKISDYHGSGHRIVIRNKVTLNQDMATSQSQMKSALKDHQQTLKNRFAKLGALDFAYSWSGRLCLTLNSVPVFGELEEGIYSANCQNGLGAVKGTLSGILAAEMAVEGSNERVDEMLKAEAPKRLPPEPFLSMGANLTMRYREWRAGKEK